jgi:hypothetical protein
MLGFARQHWPGRMVDEDEDVRVLGHGGLLLNPERGIWHCFREHVWGDAIDLVGYARYGTDWDRRQPGMFRTAVREAAAFAGVPGAGLAHAGRGHIPTARGGRPGSEPVATDPMAPQGGPPAPTVPPDSGGRHLFIAIGGRPTSEPLTRDSLPPPAGTAAPAVPPNSGGGHHVIRIRVPERPRAPGAESVAPPAATLHTYRMTLRFRHRRCP